MIMALRVQVDGDLLFQVLAASVADYPEFGNIVPRRELEKRVRKELLLHGVEHFYYWHEERHADDLDRAAVWARRQMKCHWPDMVDEIKNDHGVTF